MPINVSSIFAKPLTLLKLIGLGFLVILVLALAIRLVIVPTHSLLQRGIGNNPFLGGIGMSEPSVATDAYGEAALFSYGKMDAGTAGMPNLSIRNILPQPPMGGESVGDMAEAFETTGYHATIETGRLTDTCHAVAALKADTEIIFETTTESDHNCYYTFKVAKSRVAHVLETLEGLRPKDLTEETHTLQRTVDDFTREIEILEKKKQVIEQTLDSATRAYDQITSLATDARDAASLANIINSKIQTIERLTQEQLAVNAQLDRLTRGKAEQLDQVEYTSFSVAVIENTYLNGEQLKDSWNAAVKAFVRDINTIAQDLTLRLVTLFLLALQYLVYFFLLVIIAKIAWEAARKIWKK